MRATLLTCFLCFIFQVPVLAQGRLEKRFTMEDGLVSNSLYASFQDSKGYIWLATTNGVSRFDGKVFTNYTSSDGLPDNEIFAMEEDVKGRIWLSCYNGEPCYIYNQKIYSPATDSVLKTISIAGYFRFCHLGKKLVLTKSVGQSYEVDEKGKFRPIPVPGSYFIGFDHHLLNVGHHRADGSLKCILLNDLYVPVDSLQVEQAQGIEVYKTGENNFVFLSKDGKCERFGIRHNKIHYADVVQSWPGAKGFFYSQQQVWMNREPGGLFPVKKDLSPNLSDSPVFKDQSIQNFMIDREGNYWVCSFENGLLMSPDNGFLYYQNAESSGKEDALRITSDGTSFYYGYAKAVVRLPKNTGRRDTILNLKEKLVELYADTSKLVVATTHNLIVLNLRTKKREQLAVENIKCLHAVSSNALVYGTHSGCFLWKFAERSQPVREGRTVAVYPRSNGEILIGTLYGLKVVKKNESGSWIEEDVQGPSFLRNTRIACVNELDGVILTGTTQKGLVLTRGRDYECVNLGIGHSDINCKRIFVSRDKTIWLATYSGLFKLKLGKDIHHYTVQHIRKFNGLLSDDVNDVVCLNDTVYAAGPKGISLFPLHSAGQKDTIGPEIYLNAVLVNGVSYAATGNDLHLPYDSNMVEIRFSAIDLRSLGNLLFKYRLRGMQRDWQFSADNQIRFEAIPPGVYTLEILAMNARGYWNSQPLQLSLVVESPWWQSSWFIIFVIIVGAFTINFVVRRNVSKKHREQIRRNVFQRHLAELELRAIKAQINPHFIFNTLNVIQYFINTNENDKAEESLNRLADLLRKTLEYSDQATVPLQSEIDYLRNYLELEKLRFDEGFVFSVYNEVPDEMSSLEIPPMVLQPHIENALRHGFRDKPDGLKKLNITFRLNNNQLLCEIHDNGIGRKAAALSKGRVNNYRSRGMELSEAKLKMYAATTGKYIKTEVEDHYAEDQQTATGTTIRITINQ